MDETEFEHYIDALSRRDNPPYDEEYDHEDELEAIRELEVHDDQNGIDIKSRLQYDCEKRDETVFDSELTPYPQAKKQRVQEEIDEWEASIIVDQPSELEIPAFQKIKDKSRKHVFKLPPLGKQCITTTDFEGRRVFLELTSSNDKEEFFPVTRKVNLLATPFADIKQIVDEKRHADRLKKIDSIKAVLDGSCEGIEETSKDLYADDDDSKKETLWVDKYAPKRFTELLSDDGTNRVLLKWLKLWDEFVFGKSKISAKRKQKGESIQIDKRKPVKRKHTWDYEEELEVDASGRPVFKIALLSGNPGLGKTTLAHVLARHAGYNTVEMNASDDRSPELFKNKLEASTQMMACIGDEKKPNCLIIDEIDGAPLQAINILIQAVKETEEPLNRKKKKAQIILRRPVICICNDLYVPALRQLRQISLSLIVPQIIPARLAQRLIEISRKEEMRADMACLLALCEKSENDIRSCINTLQFIYQKHGTLSAEHLQNLTIGQKDFQKGLFYILKSVFQLPKPSRKPLGFSKLASENEYGTTNLALSQVQNDFGSLTMQSSNSVRFHNVLHLASSNSEYEKMTQGLFDNYLHVKCKDPHLETMIRCTHWLQFADHIDTDIRSNQTFSLVKFLPFLPVAFHMLMAGTMNPRINYTNSMIEFNMKVLKTKQTLEGLINDVRPDVRRNVADSLVVTDLLPCLYEIIHPTFRPINVQLYSQNEKQHLLSLITTMISYNLNYNQDRNMDGKYSYILQPNIEEIIAFPGLLQHKHLNYAAKQLVQREIDLEKMRRIEQSIKSTETEKQQEANEKSIKKNIQVSQLLKPLKPKPCKTKPVLDFFGRVIETREKTDEEKLIEKRSSVINKAVWFKFNEGYTNAVRRIIRVQDFL